MTVHSRALARRLRKLAALSWADRWLLAQAFFLLGAARLALWVIPFHRLARWLGPLHCETPPDVPAAHLDAARRIGLAVVRASPHTPWVSNCFPQALAAKFWLRRRGIPATLYLGVALHKASASAPPRAGMTAHAWLRCGALFVTGGRNHERFTITACFGG